MRLNLFIILILFSFNTFSPSQARGNVLSVAIDNIKLKIAQCSPNDSLTYISKVKHDLSLFETEKKIIFIKFKNNILELKIETLLTARMPFGRGNKSSNSGYGKYVSKTIKKSILDFQKMIWNETGKSYINKTRVPFNISKGVLTLKKIREFFPATLMKKRGIQFIKTPFAEYRTSFYTDGNHNAWKNNSIPINNTVKYTENGAIFTIKSISGGK